MTTKHTPGPWTALNRGYKSHVADGDMNWSAEIIGPGHAANARLIAAAPDLLSALEESTIALMEVARHASGKESAAIQVQIRANCETIAKAKGE